MNVKNSIDFKKALMILMFASVASACGTENMSLNPNSAKFFYTENNALPKKSIDPRISHLIGEFVNDAAQYGIDLSKGPKHILRFEFFQGLSEGVTPPFVTFGNNEGEAVTLGVCSVLEEKNPFNDKHIDTSYVIYFDSYFENYMSSFEFKAVVYHELAHCLMGAEHTKPKAIPLRHEYVRTHLHEKIEVLKENGEIEGFLPEDIQTSKVKIPHEGLVFFEGYFYPSTTINGLQKTFEDEYEILKADSIEIMDPGLERDENFWIKNLNSLIKRLFTPGE